MGKTIDKLEAGEPLDLKDKAKVVGAAGLLAVGLLYAGHNDHEAQQITDRANEEIEQLRHETSSIQFIQTDDGRQFELNLQTGQLTPIDTVARTDSPEPKG